MKIVAVNGSPRRDRGRTYRILSRVMEGAASGGAEGEILHLIDGEPQYCIHCGYPCFDRLDCKQDERVGALSRIVDQADALVIGAPVYIWQPSGLTGTFFDKTRLACGPWNRDRKNGKPALGVAVAGGTGSGVFSALQSIYGWFCLWKYQPLEPLPVTRFNFDAALDRAFESGRELAQEVISPIPIGQLFLQYDRIASLSFSRLDEIRWLAERVISALERDGHGVEAQAPMGLIAQADKRAQSGDKNGEAEHIVEALRVGLDLCPS